METQLLESWLFAVAVIFAMQKKSRSIATTFCFYTTQETLLYSTTSFLETVVLSSPDIFTI